MTTRAPVVPIRWSTKAASHVCPQYDTKRCHRSCLYDTTLCLNIIHKVQQACALCFGGDCCMCVLLCVIQHCVIEVPGGVWVCVSHMTQQHNSLKGHVTSSVLASRQLYNCHDGSRDAAQCVRMSHQVVVSYSSQCNAESLFFCIKNWLHQLHRADSTFRGNESSSCCTRHISHMIPSSSNTSVSCDIDWSLKSYFLKE